MKKSIIKVHIGKRRIITYENQNANGEVYIRPPITLLTKTIIQNNSKNKKKFFITTKQF